MDATAIAMPPLIALLEESEGLTTAVLAAAGIAARTAREQAEEELRHIPQVSGPGVETQQVYLTQRLAHLLTRAAEEAKTLKDEYVSVEHLLLAICDEEWGAGCVRLERPQSPDWVVYLPRPDGGGQNRMSPGLGRVSVRRREQHGAPRHVRIHGETHGGPLDRCSTGICRP